MTSTIYPHLLKKEKKTITKAINSNLLEDKPLNVFKMKQTQKEKFFILK